MRGQGGFCDGLETGREALGCPSWRIDMTKAVQKITLSPSRDIPFNKLVLSQSNVRHVKAGKTEESALRMALPPALSPADSIRIRPTSPES